MDMDKMGRFILELRKTKTLTQKEVALHLGVTDKAVSKWERGLSCPDIALLAPLAELLCVTTSELLNGERAQSPAPEIEQVVETALQYAQTAKKKAFDDSRFVFFAVVSGLFFLGAFSCVIVDLALSKTFTWSLVPLASIGLAWLSIAPLFLLKKHGVTFSLLLFSILLFPYLFILNQFLGGVPLLIPLGIWMAAIGVCFIWSVYLLFRKIKNKFTAGAFSILLTIPVQLLVNFVLSRYIDEPFIDVWDVMTYGILILLAAALFVFSRGRAKKR